MLVLFETPAGFALFKVLDEGKLSKLRTCGRSFPHQSRLRQVTHLCFLMLSFKNRHLIFSLGSLI